MARAARATDPPRGRSEAFRQIMSQAHLPRGPRHQIVRKTRFALRYNHPRRGRRGKRVALNVIQVEDEPGERVRAPKRLVGFIAPAIEPEYTPTEIVMSEHDFKDTTDWVTGPVVGHVTPSTARLWVRGAGPGSVYAWVGQQPDLSDARMAAEAERQPQAGFAAVVEVSDLQPGTRYFYALTPSPTPPAGSGPYPSFRTAPTEDASTFTFVFGSCFAPQNAYGEAAVRRLLSVMSGPDAPDFGLLLGDQIYADEPRQNGLGKIAQTEADYREVYRLAWAETAWRDALANLPWRMIWDDHEVDNDWFWTSPDRVEARPGWLTRLRRRLGGYPRELWALIPHRRLRAAVQTFWEHQMMHGPPLRLPPAGVENHRPLLLTSNRGHFGYTFTHGPAAFYVLDLHSHRYMASYGRSMMNAEQWTDLEHWLLEVRDRYPFKFLVSSVSVFFQQRLPFGGGRWDEFPDERRRLVHLINAHQIEGVFFLSGDLHVAHIVEAELEGVARPLPTWEFSVSPWGQKVFRYGGLLGTTAHFPGVRASRWLGTWAVPNFGWVRAGTQPQPWLEFRLETPAGPRVQVRLRRTDQGWRRVAPEPGP